MLKSHDELETAFIEQMLAQDNYLKACSRTPRIRRGRRGHIDNDESWRVDHEIRAAHNRCQMAEKRVVDLIKDRIKVSDRPVKS